MHPRIHLAATVTLLLVLPAPARAQQIIDRCFNLLAGGDFARAAEVGRLATRRTPGQRTAHLCLGRALTGLGEMAQALAELKEVEKLSRTKEELLVAYNWLGVIHQGAGDLEAATLMYDRELRLARDLGQRTREATALNNLATVFQRRGDTDHALEYLQRALEMTDSESARATAYNNIGLLYNERNEQPKAIEYLEKSLALHQREGDYQEVATTRLNLGAVLHDARDLPGAEREIDRGLAGVRKLGDRYWETTGLLYLASLRLDQRQRAEAKSAYQAALGLARAIGAQPLVGSAARGLAAIEQAEQTRVYAGIEVGAKGVKGLVLAVRPDGRGGRQWQERFRRSINSNTMAGAAASGLLKPEAIEDTSRAIDRLLGAMKAEAEIEPAAIEIVASSAVGQTGNRSALAGRVRQLTGKELRFVDAAQEVFYNVIGSMPTEQEDHGLSIDVGSGNTKVGYLVASGAERSAVAIELPFGTVSMAEGAAAVRQPERPFPAVVATIATEKVRSPLANQIAAYPALRQRSPVYLTGGAAWALVTLLHPEQLGDYARLEAGDFVRFRTLVSDPKRILDPDLERITDPKLRARAAGHLEAVKKTFTREDLVAAAVLLETLADELRLADRPVYFSRYGSWLFGYLYSAAAAAVPVEASVRRSPPPNGR